MTKVVELCQIYKHLTLEDLQNEVWTDIESFEGFYRLSNMGRVESLEREVRLGCNTRILSRKILIPGDDKVGYLSVVLHKEGIGKRVLLQRLVGHYFIPNPDNLPEVNHKWGNKWDNRACALEWSTRSNNMKHAFATGLKQPMRGSKQGRSKLKEHEVLEIRELLKNDVMQKDIAKLFNVKSVIICQIKKGTRWGWLE